MNGPTPDMLLPAHPSWRKCCVILHLPIRPLSLRREENEMPKVASQDYRDAMACLGAAVNIVTTDGRAGRAGFTASAVCSVTDNPPTLLVCMNRGSSAYASVRENGVVCVNVLSARHERLSRLFGGRISFDERFAAAAWLTLETGAPALADCAVAFDCRIFDSPMSTRMTYCFAEWWHCRNRTVRTT